MDPRETNAPISHDLRPRSFFPILFLVACTTSQSPPQEDATITFRFRFPEASTAKVVSKTTLQSSWPQYQDPIVETIEEVSQLTFGKAAVKTQLEHHESKETATENAILYENLRLEHKASFGPPVPLSLLERMRFNFTLDTSASLASFENLQLDPQSLQNSKRKKTSPFHLRFARESAWPAWLKTLSNRTVQLGNTIQFEVNDYPVGCLGPSTTSRMAEVKITELAACPDTAAPSDLQKKPAEEKQLVNQCVRIELSLTANQASIIQNIKDTLGTADQDILDSLVLNEATCKDTIKALMNSHTMRLFQAEYTSKDDLSAANSTFKDGKQIIKSKVLSKSSQYDWDDNLHGDE